MAFYRIIKTRICNLNADNSTLAIGLTEDSKKIHYLGEVDVFARFRIDSLHPIS